jgi:hypothetical protein
MSSLSSPVGGLAYREEVIQSPARGSAIVSSPLRFATSSVVSAGRPFDEVK